MKGSVMHATKVQEKKTREKKWVRATFEQVISKNILSLIKNLKSQNEARIKFKNKKNWETKKYVVLINNIWQR